MNWVMNYKKKRGMAAKAVRIENNSDKKKRVPLVKIITYNFLHKIGFIFVTMKTFTFYSIVYLQQP